VATGSLLHTVVGRLCRAASIAGQTSAEIWLVKRIVAHSCYC